MKTVKRSGRRARVVTLSQHVMDKLGAAIVRGRFAEGAVLPTEAALCVRFGVSRTPLREAIKKLHGKGLISVGPKSGTRVRSSRDWHQLDPDVLRWRLQTGPDDEILRQLYELRAGIEPEACRFAALNGGPEDHAAIGAAFERMEACRADIAAVVEADVGFHLSIIHATRNIFFSGLASAIGNALYTAFLLGARRRTFPADELAQHRAVWRAIATRKGDLAARLMRKLLATSRRSVALQTSTPCVGDDPKPKTDRRKR
jgi:DNA-binding FadR family transcriptional regulator